MCASALMCILCIHGWFYLIMKQNVECGWRTLWSRGALCNSDWPASRRTKCDTSLSARSDFAKISLWQNRRRDEQRRRYTIPAIRETNPKRVRCCCWMLTSVLRLRETPPLLFLCPAPALLCALHIVTLHRNAQRAPLALWLVIIIITPPPCAHHALDFINQKVNFIPLFMFVILF